MIEIQTEVEPLFDETAKQLRDGLKEYVEAGMKLTARLAPVEMQTLMTNSPASGKLYRRSGIEGASRFHQASSIGEPPSPDSGDLIGSLKGTYIGDGEAEIEMLWYGKYWDERGRVFIEPAIDTSAQKAFDRVS